MALKGVNNMNLDWQYRRGAENMNHIPLEQLKDGALYEGICRNATQAIWHADKKQFTYKRHKFGDTFDEDICPPELDDGFDLFYAFKLIKQ